ncbi:uncharacterized protein LOC130738398 isoform X2 [Lotus japonicus]|uniref:uncharacterized protein LOC130738398 isoform X2 n=1 Tax=Lotus japonicus TaxID=34305 RepID=UPI0025881076|nr:uncharacterized protein LOC130738398 isoform X2 [Lotus japonicus]
MDSYKIFLLFIIVNLFCFAINEAQEDPFYLYQDCSSEKTNANTSFQLTLTKLLSSLSSHATDNTQFYNTTSPGNNPSDSISVMFMCRGDVSSNLCQLCIDTARGKLSTQCPLSKEANIWYEECMVRYSTTSLFSTMVKDTSFKMHNSGNVSNPASFKRLLLDTINKTVDLAALPPIGDKKFATTEVPFTGHETLYILAQCTPDLSPLDCRTCLSAMVGALPNCCEGKVGGRVASPSCNIRYELYPFFYHPSVSSSSVLALSPNTSRADSPDPTYLSHNCSTNKNFTANSTFQTHITTLLSYLSSNSTNTKFHKADVGGTVYGLFMCQFDLPPHLCQKCVSDAIHQTPSVCGTAQEAVIWYTHCMFRYSNGNFFYKVDTSSVYSDLNITSNNTSIYKMEQNMIVRIAKTVDNAAIQAGDSDERHGTVSSKLNDGLTLYALAQCTHDLAINDCKGCLGVVIGEAIPWTYLGSIGGRVMYPSCSLRFELFLFYKEPNNSLSPNGVPSSARATMGKGKVDANPLKMKEYLAQSAAAAKKRAAETEQKKKNEGTSGSDNVRDPKRQKTSGAAGGKPLHQSTLDSKSRPAEKKKGHDNVPPPQQDPSTLINRPSTPFGQAGPSSAIGGEAPPPLLSLSDPHFNGLEFMTRTFDNRIHKDISGQGPPNIASMAIHHALSAASTVAGMAQCVKELISAKNRFEKKAADYKTAYEQAKTDAETANNKLKSAEEKCAKLTEDLAASDLLLQKTKSLKEAINDKHTAIQAKYQKLEKKHDRLNASILGRASLQYAQGFLAAKEQISVVEPGFDLSRIGWLKEIKDGQVVGDDDISLDLLPQFNDESEPEEDGEDGNEQHRNEDQGKEDPQAGTSQGNNANNENLA